eukprot:1862975-Rhodomonas_salina.2
MCGTARVHGRQCEIKCKTKLMAVQFVPEEMVLGIDFAAYGRPDALAIGWGSALIRRVSPLTFVIENALGVANPRPSYALTVTTRSRSQRPTRSALSSYGMSLRARCGIRRSSTDEAHTVWVGGWRGR